MTRKKDTRPSRPKKLTRKQRVEAGEWTPVFLSRLRETGNVRDACETAKISRKTAYLWREENPEFALDWQENLDDSIDSLELIGRSRAAATSDTLLIFFLKSHRPQVYGENRHLYDKIDELKRMLDGYITSGTLGGTGEADSGDAAE